MKNDANDSNSATNSFTITRCSNCFTENFIYLCGTVIDKHYCEECGEEI